MAATPSTTSHQDDDDVVAMELGVIMQALAPLLPSTSQFLGTLEKLEIFLLGLGQMESISTQRALGSLMKVLASKELSNHHDMDLQVCMASCFSEVLRITAPDAPYEDEILKESFRLIVSAFADISNMSSYSYHKRVSILKTVAQVRSCIIMLDLNCGALIINMFSYFLRNIREGHPDVVFSSMGLIMIVVIEEMSEVPIELLSILLDHARTENKGILPVAQRLAERVIENCAQTLAPYMPQAVQNTGHPLGDYGAIIIHVYLQSQATSGTLNSLHIAFAERQHIDEHSLASTAGQLEPSQNECLMLTMTTGDEGYIASVSRKNGPAIQSPRQPKRRKAKTLKCSITLEQTSRCSRMNKACRSLEPVKEIVCGLQITDNKCIPFSKTPRAQVKRRSNRRKRKILSANGDEEMLVLEQHSWKLHNGKTTSSGGELAIVCSNAALKTDIEKSTGGPIVEVAKSCENSPEADEHISMLVHGSCVGVFQVNGNRIVESQDDTGENVSKSVNPTMAGNQNIHAFEISTQGINISPPKSSRSRGRPKKTGRNAIP